MKTKYIIPFIIVLLIIGFTLVQGQSRPEETIRIGALLPLTGVEARQGEIIKNALLMAEKDGSTKERRVQITIEDTKNDVKTALSAYQLLKNQNIPIILTIGSPSALAIAPLANQDRIVLFAIAAAPGYASPNDFTFRMIPGAVKEADDMSGLVSEKLKITKLAVLSINNDYGVGTKKAFVKAFMEKGGSILADETFFPDATDFRIELLKIKAKKPQAIYLASWGKQAGMIIRQAKELGIDNVQFLCGQACQNPDLIKEGGQASEGIIYPYTFLKTDTNFYKEYTQQYGESPTQISERMYDVAKIGFQIIRDCKEQGTDCLLTKLQTERYSGTSGPIYFDSNGDVVENFVLYTVNDGVFTAF